MHLLRLLRHPSSTSYHQRIITLLTDLGAAQSVNHTSIFKIVANIVEAAVRLKVMLQTTCSLSLATCAVKGLDVRYAGFVFQEVLRALPSSSELRKKPHRGSEVTDEPETKRTKVSCSILFFRLVSLVWKWSYLSFIRFERLQWFS